MAAGIVLKSGHEFTTHSPSGTFLSTAWAGQGSF